MAIICIYNHLCSKLHTLALNVTLHAAKWASSVSIYLKWACHHINSGRCTFTPSPLLGQHSWLSDHWPLGLFWAVGSAGSKYSAQSAAAPLMSLIHLRLGSKNNVGVDTHFIFSLPQKDTVTNTPHPNIPVNEVFKKERYTSGMFLKQAAGGGDRESFDTTQTQTNCMFHKWIHIYMRRGKWAVKKWHFPPYLVQIR